MDRRLADLLEALRASRKQVRVQDGRLYIGPPPVEPALLALVRQHRDELVAYLTERERHGTVERARSLLEAGAIPTRPLATALGRVENPQRVVRALVAVSRYRLPPESRAAVERELAAILAALRNGPERPPTPDRTIEHPGNDHGPPLERRRCPVCRQPYEVRATDRPGWLQVRCACRDGTWDWMRASTVAHG